MKPTVDYNFSHFILTDANKTEHMINYDHASQLYYNKEVTFTNTAKKALEEIQYEEAIFTLP